MNFRKTVLLEELPSGVAVQSYPAKALDPLASSTTFDPDTDYS